ncbi:hypothetical protein ACFXG4_27085 [Nocardia sp. NPDC059246]|uniref:glycine-rich domain-containing protein n=1 Tax=unclassified Nocardia TaxID=2637762 RepID=UPI0036BCB708
MSFPAGAGNLSQGQWAGTGKDGSLPGLAGRTQDAVSAALKQQLEQSPNWSGLGPAFKGAIGGMGDMLLGQLVSTLAGVDINFDILGIDIDLRPLGFLGAWGQQLQQQGQQALAGVSSIASGVTGNITGASSSSDPSHVGTAVNTLNTTVQTNAQPPSITIVNTTRNYTQIPGTKSFTFNLFAGGGGGARGPSVSGSGMPGGGGGVGGWEQVTILASALPSTFTCNVGSGAGGAGADNNPGYAGGTTSITDTSGTTIYASAGGGGAGQPIPTSATLPTTAYNGAPGTGNMTWALTNLSGGAGGLRGISGGVGSNGSNGSSGTGGTGGASGAGTGGTGGSNTSTVVPGLGGSGGGGGDGGATGSAGNGGNGGAPGGGGGGGGAFYAAGFNGNGGASGPGQIWIQANF